MFRIGRYLLINNYGLRKLPNIFIPNLRQYASEAEFELPQFKLHKLEKGPPKTGKITRDEALKLYYQMSIIRRFENFSAELYMAKKIRGFLHLYAAEEAICVGMKSMLRPEDKAITAYRCHGWAYVFGMEVKTIFAELMGKVTGCSRGKGGSMHMYAPLFPGGGGIVGANVPIGAGLAFAFKYLKQPNVVVIAYGDGAANQGQVFETYNLAKLHNLSCIFVCENNTFGMGTPIDIAAANTQFHTRCEYIPGIWVDGMDVVAVREATKFGIDHCLNGNGPIIMEMNTYRYFGHSMSDPGVSYRTREQVQEIRKNRDPINQFKDRLIVGQLATEDEIKAIEKKVKEEVNEEAKQSNADAFPKLEELTADIYRKPLVDKVRGVSPWDIHEAKNFGKPVNL